MTSKFVLRTLSIGALWLVLQNFNISTSEKTPLYVPAFAEKNCPKHACLGVHPAQKLENSGNFKNFQTLDKAISAAKARKGNYKIKKVVLDAGHGGKDPGCLGTASREKHNTLAIVLKLGALIEQSFSDVEVIYTRDSDVFIELNERAAIANRNNADLFISVHCNAMSVSTAVGTETYVMGLHTAKHNLEVAKRENASILMEDNYKVKYEGYDPDSPEAHILGSMWQSAYLEQSILFAGFVQEFAHSVAERDNRGVKQAGFLVLRETAMPAVLVEAGYLTNPKEDAFLATDEGRALMAESIYQAFRAYKEQIEGRRVEPLGKSAVVSRPVQTQTSKIREPEADKTTVIAQQSTPAKTARPGAPKGENVRTKPANAPEIQRSTAFRIHLMSWSRRMDTGSGQMALLTDVKEEMSAGKYHYYTGNFATRSEAERMLSELKNIGFKTAAIVEK
jgi:N-acetylmuramoyl-L-alanine amidase